MRGINKVMMLGVISFPEIPEDARIDGHLRFDIGVLRPTKDGGETIITVPCLASGRLAEILSNYTVPDVTMLYLEGWLRPFGPEMVVSADTIQLLKVGRKDIITGEE